MTVIAFLPLAATITMAVFTRKILLSLISGVLLGLVLVIQRDSLTHAIALASKVFNTSNCQIVILLFIISGFVSLLEHAGGISALTRKLIPLIKSKKQLQLMTYFSGLVLFFTDSGNSLILGPLYKPLFDKMRICREKLAYILDATSSPVCVLIPFIGWGIYISSLIESALPNSSKSGFSLLISSFGFQFYAYFTLLSVPFFILKNTHFKAMKAKQIPCERLNLPISEAKSNRNTHFKLFFYPFILLLGTAATLFLSMGLFSSHNPLNHLKTILILSYGVSSMMLMLMLKKDSMIKSTINVFLKGAKKIFPILQILILAWCLSTLCKALGTDILLANLVINVTINKLLPLFIFAITSIIALATGSSWGSYSILLPITLAMATQLNLSYEPVIGAVLSGGLLGDHISPLSDTTILSSYGAGCTPKSHVVTQLPYALCVATLSALAFLIIGIVFY
jgi:Na+/H+ antiporter NhaC